MVRKGDVVTIKEIAEFGKLLVVGRVGQWIQCQALTGLAAQIACGRLGETIWIRSKDLECAPPQEETLL